MPKLNVARLSGANLTQAQLHGTLLNVANLISADLRKANLQSAILICVEMIRAELTGANLQSANLSGSDLREAILSKANLSGSNLKDANLGRTLLTRANLEQANLENVLLTNSDLIGANLRGANLLKASLRRANLREANLSGTNLSETNLSGANLRCADLTNANLQSANLEGADLRLAKLGNANLANANLSDANLMEVDWLGADLTGATLTGAKLYGVSRFGIETKGLICNSLDLSPEGDIPQIYQFTTAETAAKFFNQSIPTLEINVAADLTLNGSVILAAVYEKLAKIYPAVKKPPSIKVSSRRTVLNFELDSNEELFPAAYTAIFPFEDCPPNQRYLVAFLRMLKLDNHPELDSFTRQRIQEIKQSFSQVISSLSVITFPLDTLEAETARFFQAPTRTILINSSKVTLEIYSNPNFGYLTRDAHAIADEPTSVQAILPKVKTLIEFITAGNHLLEQSQEM